MRGQSRGILLGGLLLLVLLGARWVPGLLRAARLLGDVAAPEEPAGEGVSEEPVAEGPLRGTLYRPAEGEPPFPAFVACHGAAKEGFRDARLVRFARALARSGSVVLAPDLEDLRCFRVTEESVGRIVEAQRALCSRTDLVQGGRASLIGISFAGTLSLLAAADPGVRDSVPAVLSFGGYADLEGLIRYWLEAAPESPPGEYPVESYGKVIAILNNLDPLVPEAEREPLREGLERFLREKRPPPRPPDLGVMAADLWDAATTVGPTRPDLVERIVLAAGPGAHLVQPSGRLEGLRARVFLLHAAGDRLIPPRESERLASIVGEPSRLLLTPLFEHVTVRSGGSLERWRLVRFAAAFLEASDG